MHHLVRRTPLALVAAYWSRHSAEGAVRNAMTATTACAARRRERQEVAEFISNCLAARAV